MKKLILQLIALSIVLKPNVLLANLISDVQDATYRYLQNHFLNASFMFADNNKVIVLGAHGVFNLEGVELAPNKKMPIGSVTKAMTAAAILKLQERKLINVQDSIIEYIDAKAWPSGIPPKWAYNITIHHLLTHTSGIAEYLYSIKVSPEMSNKEIYDAVLSIASSKPLANEPGKKYKFSNTNYILLGLIIENITKIPLCDFFKQEFFEPLKMRATHLASLEEGFKLQIASGSLPYPERYTVIPTNYARAIFKSVPHEAKYITFADGGVISNVSDLIKWNRALHGAKLLSNASYKLMTTPYIELPDGSYGGYGIVITKLNNGDIIYSNSSSRQAKGIRAETGYVAGKDFYFAILSNISEEVSNTAKNTEMQFDIVHFKDAILKAVNYEGF